MQKIPIKNIDIVPTLVDTYFFTSKITDKPKKIEFRNVNIFEIELFIESAGGIYVDNKYHPVQANDLILRHPGQTTQAVTPFTCYCIRFSINNREDVFWENEILNNLPLITHLKNPIEFRHFFEEVLEAHINPNTFSDFTFKINILKILKKLFETNHSLDFISGKKISNPYIVSGVDYINSNWDKELSIHDISNYIGLSKNYFLKLFSDNTGETPNNYIQKLKMKHAKELLVYSDMSISEVAASCGIDNFSYFSTLFKKYTGSTPKQWRENYRVLDSN